ncbi:hypothetical protein [Pedobacter sp. Leaf41]|uniref:hypothetical protein n=1 Tax=Pedobacter sp. Leaf41 TaxID=1736218 RepID=UPI000AA269AF|nr:hypothetical protein [Pedobacter sp. Leaf41]
MSNPTPKQKLLYFVCVVICLFLLAVLLDLGDLISQNFIKTLPKTYTVQQDEKREWWASAFTNI